MYHYQLNTHDECMGRFCIYLYMIFVDVFLVHVYIDPNWEQMYNHPKLPM